MSQYKFHLNPVNGAARIYPACEPSKTVWSTSNMFKFMIEHSEANLESLIPIPMAKEVLRQAFRIAVKVAVERSARQIEFERSRRRECMALEPSAN